MDWNKLDCMWLEESEKKLIVYANHTCGSVMTTYLGTIYAGYWLHSGEAIDSSLFYNRNKVKHTSSIVVLNSAVKFSVYELEAKKRTVLKDDFCRGWPLILGLFIICHSVKKTVANEAVSIVN